MSARAGRLAADVASHAARVVSNVACVLVLTPVLVERLGLAGFGGWALALTALAWLQAAELGAVSAATKLAAEGRGRGDPGLEHAAARVLGRRLLWTAALIGPAAWAAAPWAARLVPELPPGELERCLRWVAAAAAALLPLSLGPGLLQGRGQHMLFNGLFVAGRLLQVVLTLVVIACWPTLEAAVVATLAGQLLTALGHSVAAWATRPAAPRASADAARLASIREQGRAFGWINVAVLLGSQTDVLLAGVLAGPAGAGLYRVAERTTQHLAALVKQLSGVLGPEVARAHAQGAARELRALFLFGCRWTMLVGAPPLALLATWGDWLLGAWLGPVGRQAGPLAALVWAALLVSLLQAQAVQQLALTGQHQRVARVFVGAALCNVLLSAALGSAWGEWGIAAGTLLTVSVVDVAWFIPAGCRQAGVSIRELCGWALGRTASLACGLGLALAAVRWLRPEPALGEGVAWIGLTHGLFVLGWLVWAARPEEREHLARLGRRVRELARRLHSERASTGGLSACESSSSATSTPPTSWAATSSSAAT